MNTSLPPTLLPDNWTPAKDKAYCDAHGGAHDLDSLLAEVFRARRKLGDNLNKVLTGFGATVEGCSAVEKLFIIENIARADTLNKDYLAWMLEAVFYARYSIEQFERLTAIYSADSEVKWLMPLTELASHLETAGELSACRRCDDLLRDLWEWRNSTRVVAWRVVRIHR